MQILHHEVVDQSMPLFALILLMVLSVVVSIYLAEKMFIRVIIFIGLGLIWTSLYSVYKTDIAEYQKVIVEDWNVVHSEGWEVISQEGDIVELKRKLEEK